MASKSIRISLLLLTYWALLSCGDYDPDQVILKAPRFNPVDWFTGSKIGYRMITDRNGNIKEIANVRRSCRLQTPLTGSCKDKIQYQYHPEKGIKELQFDWKVHYTGDDRAWVTLQSSEGKVTGFLRGPLLDMDGKGLAPESTNQTGLNIRLYALSGPNDPVEEREFHTYLGVQVGEVRTFWISQTDRNQAVHLQSENK